MSKAEYQAGGISPHGHESGGDSKHMPVREQLDPRHFYAAYIFDQAQEYKRDITTVIHEASVLGRPVRYWWLSEAMATDEFPDRLIVCVHHPSSDENAGMDLYQTLRQKQVKWHDLEAAHIDEYRFWGKKIYGPADIRHPDQTWLFPDLPRPNPQVVEWSNPHKGVSMQLAINDPRMAQLPAVARERIRLAMTRFSTIVVHLLDNEYAFMESADEYGLFGMLAEHMTSIATVFEMMRDKPKFGQGIPGDQVEDDTPF